MSTRTLTTTLPSDTLYVSGTVNGVSTTWTNTSGNTWETIAERSMHDVYVVSLTIINNLGTSTDTTFTLYYGLHLVTDRTKSDVVVRNEKGTYNASDLNRVGSAMNYLADRLKEAGYDPHISPKTDWKDDEWVDLTAQAVYLGDLSELRKQFAMMESTPEVPPRLLATGINTNDGLTYTWANDIEKILEDVDYLLTKSIQSRFFSGELFSGEV